MECRICHEEPTDDTGIVQLNGDTFCLTCWMNDAVRLYVMHFKIIAGFLKILQEHQTVIEKYEHQAECFNMPKEPNPGRAIVLLPR
ncbi:MAG: hypothetical protein UY48_C0013G0030 [Candidatus Gottesmanbacteria bacterium GW2011_GWB1_49_7]|uniref:Uncharacterized protein n=1 Tax=Candidatus Gottesmanbacteria bacterium GW2011_GWB1_49_7 TaxID=1618448 RepID=A0A0G1YZE3_9BACT|nr:MAG: hypothetical protein UY48_C0013G0030 [Candidatus Gottesmanbacteria bacterium GW2011_GWB1_49_7]